MGQVCCAIVDILYDNRKTWLGVSTTLVVGGAYGWIHAPPTHDANLINTILALRPGWPQIPTSNYGKVSGIAFALGIVSFGIYAVAYNRRKNQNQSNNFLSRR